MKNNLSTINFQLFAHGDGGEPNPPAGGTGIEGLEDKDSYTKEDILSFAQKYADSKVTEALKTRDKKESKAIEAIKLEKLSEEERKAKEVEDLKKEISELKKSSLLRDNKISLQSEMSKRGIPVELSDFLISEDAEVMLKNLQTFENALKNLVNTEVTKRLKSNIPNGGSTAGSSSEGLTKEKFAKMTIQQQMKIYNEDKELYMKLIN